MMNRREALRTIGLGTGFVVLSSPLLSMLQGCTAEKETWTPNFLSEDEGKFLRHVVDIILPKTDGTPSATEVNVPEFIDTYWNEVLMEDEQQKQKKSIAKMVTAVKTEYNEDLDEVSEEQYKAVLDKYLLLKGDRDPQRDENPNDSDFVSDYEFMGSLKWITINAYRGSEQVGEKILFYDPVPSQYYCGNLQELTGGRANSL